MNRDFVTPDSFLIDLEGRVTVDGVKLPLLVADDPVTVEVMNDTYATVTCTFIVPNDSLTVLPKRKKD